MYLLDQNTYLMLVSPTAETHCNLLELSTTVGDRCQCIIFIFLYSCFTVLRQATESKYFRYFKYFTDAFLLSVYL